MSVIQNLEHNAAGRFLRSPDGAYSLFKRSVCESISSEAASHQEAANHISLISQSLDSFSRKDELSDFLLEYFVAATEETRQKAFDSLLMEVHNSFRVGLAGFIHKESDPCATFVDDAISFMRSTIEWADPISLQGCVNGIEDAYAYFREIVSDSLQNVYPYWKRGELMDSFLGNFSRRDEFFALLVERFSSSDEETYREAGNCLYSMINSSFRDEFIKSISSAPEGREEAYIEVMQENILGEFSTEGDIQRAESIGGSGAAAATVQSERFDVSALGSQLTSGAAPEISPMGDDRHRGQLAGLRKRVSEDGDLWARRCSSEIEQVTIQNREIIRGMEVGDEVSAFFLWGHNICVIGEKNPYYIAAFSHVSQTVNFKGFKITLLSKGFGVKRGTLRLQGAIDFHEQIAVVLHSGVTRKRIKDDWGRDVRR
ncbi:hypothetical protein [Streptomyces cinereoruber]|uniref:hypothetical protein n=1 Tax=Streptomyces cinereoruber TaxID=67260 RepID=UPI00365F4C64